MVLQLYIQRQIALTCVSLWCSCPATSWLHVHAGGLRSNRAVSLTFKLKLLHSSQASVLVP